MLPLDCFSSVNSFANRFFYEDLLLFIIYVINKIYEINKNENIIATIQCPWMNKKSKVIINIAILKKSNVKALNKSIAPIIKYPWTKQKIIIKIQSKGASIIITHPFDCRSIFYFFTSNILIIILYIISNINTLE